MEVILKWLIILKIIFAFDTASSETYSVKIFTENYVNKVDQKFLSFTVDPKYLFLSDGKFNSKECSCMASALAPAYLRIAGPSTERMSLNNASIVLTEGEGGSTDPPLSISHKQWRRFASWANHTGFELVFALNSAEKTANGLWDPNIAISVLTVAEKANISGIYWQLGYECKNQSIEDYLNDLQTLRVIVDTFSKPWKVVGGDVTPCLHESSKSDFKDYVVLSDEMLDAILLDGNSSSHELNRLSPKDRNKLLTTLAQSSTPLWISDQTLEVNNELMRAANWMYSLGEAAKNGFNVHYRELVGDELVMPTLSFYMALLFKNLVGSRVLEASFEHSDRAERTERYERDERDERDERSKRVSMFAHCAELRHKRVEGAVTLFGANVDEEAARFSVRLGGREEGGDIMQFILGLDANGNIIVNGRPMFFEGDIRPVVKRVRPYKTLLINLPPKSFGFWVLANTKVEACYDDIEPLLTVENNATDVNEIDDKTRRKRSVEDLDNGVEGLPENKDLVECIQNINKDLKNLKLSRHERVTDNNVDDGKRKRRQLDNKKTLKDTLKLKKPVAIQRPSKNIMKETRDKPKVSLAERLAEINERINTTRQQRKERAKKLLARNKVTKRNSSKLEFKPKPKEVEKENESEEHKRSKRSILNQKKKFEDDIQEVIADNEIDLEGGKYKKFGKLLHKINEKLNEVSNPETPENDSIEEQLTLKTRISKDDATINLTEKSSSGILKSAVSKVLSLFEEVSEKLDGILNSVDVLN